MRKVAATILFSSVRRQVLATILLHPQKSWYLSELGRQIDAAPSHLHRELAALVEAGILNKRNEGRQTYFSANPDCEFLPELTGLLRKLVGIPDVIAGMLRPLRARIRTAFIYGSVARGQETSGSDIDLMIVGEVTLSDLVNGLHRAEKTLGRPVNPTIYPPEELAAKLAAGHHFVSAVIEDRAKLFVVGTADDLEAVTRRKPDSAAPHQQSGARRTARRGRSKA